MSSRSTARTAASRCLLVLLVAIAVGLAACSSRSEGYTPPDTSGPYRGTLLPAPLPRPSFTLVDTSGAFYDFSARTQGSVTLVYFGYTYCPDICPDHMAKIAAVLKRLPDDLSSRVNVVFITVDPERDTTARLREWLDLFDPTFIGLTADTRSVDSAMRKALGDLYFPITREDLGNGEYSVSHAAFVIAYTPDNSAHVVYPFGMQQDDWEHDIYKLTTAGWLEPAKVAQESSGKERGPSPAPSPGDLPVVNAPGSRGATPAEEPRQLLAAPFTPVTLEAVRDSVHLAFGRHPDASRLMSQGMIPSRENLDLELRICGSRPESGSTDSALLACSTLGGCARLTRILYDFYVQTGYEEFFEAALNVYNYVGTSLPAESEAFRLIVRSELRLTGLPSG